MRQRTLSNRANPATFENEAGLITIHEPYH